MAFSDCDDIAIYCRTMRRPNDRLTWPFLKRSQHADRLNSSGFSCLPRPFRQFGLILDVERRLLAVESLGRTHWVHSNDICAGNFTRRVVHRRRPRNLRRALAVGYAMTVSGDQRLFFLDGRSFDSPITGRFAYTRQTVGSET